MALEDGGYIFGGDTGLSYEQLKQRRAIAQALASRNQGFPKNKGEGLTYLGQSIGEALSDIGLQMREARYRKGLRGDSLKIPTPQPITSPPATSPPPAEKTSEVTPPVDTPPPPPPAPVAETPVDTSPGAMVGFDPDVAPAPQAASPPPPVDVGESWDPNAGAVAATPPPPPAPVMPQGPPMTSPPRVSVDPNAPAPLTGGNVATPQDLSMASPRDRVAMAMLLDQSKMAQPEAPTGLSASAAPVSTPDVPLPRGDPRTTSGVRATMEAALSRGGQSPAAISGIERNVRDESGFDPNLRHPDQPGFSGEARYAHGLYQEGGDEWNNYVNWIDKNAPGSDWRDPNLQSKFLAERLQDPQYARTNTAMNREGATPSSAAVDFLGGYLKPAPQYLAQRAAQYSREGGDTTYANRAVAQGGDSGTATAGARTGGGGGREGGAPEDDTRDLVTAALLEQPQKPQDTGQQSEDLLPDVVGMTNRAVLPQRPTAALGRAGVASDTSLPALAPMGSLTGAPGPAAAPPAPTAPDGRDAIAAALTAQQSVADPTGTATQPAPTTVTDIQPAPVGVAAGAQTAQAAPAPQAAPVPTQQPGIGTQATPQQFTTPPVEPRQPPPTPPTPTETQAQVFKRQYIDNPQAVQYADDIIKNEQAKRALIDARADEKYKLDYGNYKDQLTKWQDYQRNTPQREQTYTAEQQKIQNTAETQAIQQRLGTQDPAKFFENFDKEKNSAIQASSTLEANRLASSAIKNGVITGTLADPRINIAKLRAWAYDNKVAGDEAAQTEILKAALTNSVGASVRTIQPGDPKVTDADIRLAKLAAGADPSLQLTTIQTLLNKANEINHRTLNDFEDKRDYYLGGTRTERQYQFPIQETAPSAYTQRLVEHKDDPVYRKEYDDRFGVGAADHEIARAQRRSRRGG